MMSLAGRSYGEPAPLLLYRHACYTSSSVAVAPGTVLHHHVHTPRSFILRMLFQGQSK